MCINRHLQDVIFNDDLNFTKEFTSSFVRDAILVGYSQFMPEKNSGHTNTNPGFQGLVYLHDTCQLVHGALTTRSCFVTKYWTIKLSDYGLNDVIDELIQNDMIIPVGERTIDGYFRIF